MKATKPDWLRIRMSDNGERRKVEALLKSLSLNTVCKEANCPNLMECYGRKTATFMILGSVCSRNCRFCAVSNGKPSPPDPKEPLNIARAVLELKLKHAVITMVTRDDLIDGGAGQVASVIKEVRKASPETTVEVLISDLKGDIDSLKVVASAKPDIIGHNIETVPHLYKEVRPQAVYVRSLAVLENIKKLDSNIMSKTGIMVGLGETRAEMTQIFRDLNCVGCDILTIGQYLSPSKEHLPVAEYVHPDVFNTYKDEARALGIKYVVSGPLVRSSYHAENVFKNKTNK